LLTLLGEVGLLGLGYLIVIVALEHEHAEGVLRILDFVKFILVLVGLVSLLFFQVLNLLLSALSFNLTLFPLAFSLSLVGLALGLG